MVHDGEHLDDSVPLSVDDAQRKSPQEQRTAYVWRMLDVGPLGRFVDTCHRAKKMFMVTGTEAAMARFVESDLPEMFCFRRRVKAGDHRNRALAFRSTSSDEDQVYPIRTARRAPSWSHT
jgi:hypothetical protein